MGQHLDLEYYPFLLYYLSFVTSTNYLGILTTLYGMERQLTQPFLYPLAHVTYLNFHIIHRLDSLRALRLTTQIAFTYLPSHLIDMLGTLTLDLRVLLIRFRITYCFRRRAFTFLLEPPIKPSYPPILLPRPTSTYS